MKKLMIVVSIMFVSLVLSACEPDEKIIECPKGQEQIGDLCEDIPLVCPEGQHIEEEVCVMDYVAPDFNEIYNETGAYYQIFVRSFADSDNDGVGDFNGITAKLDYLVDLGVEGIWLMPIHPSPSYHGYDVSDYFAVNSEYGTMEDFETLLAEAELKGIDIIIDLVLNHTSSEHEWFTEWKAGNPDYAGYYRKITSGDSRLGENGSWGQNIWHSMEGGYYCGYFSTVMPDLNWSNVAVREQMTDVALYWLEKGVKGFRVDAALHIEGEGEVLPGTVPIESTLNKLLYFEIQLEMEYPDMYLIVEVFDDFDVSSKFYRSADSALNFETGGMILGAIRSGFSTNYVSKLETHYDVIADSEDGIDAPFLYNHDQDRLASILNGNQTELRLAAEMLLTLEGNPFIYYGEELGMFGVKSSGPYWDETRRLPLPFGDAYTTSWFEDTFNTNLDNVTEQQNDEESLFNVYRTLLNLRKESPALKYGDLIEYEEGSNILLGYYRVFNYDALNQEVVLVLHNVSDHPYAVGTNLGDVIYYSNGISSFDGNIEGQSTIIIQVSNDIIGELYE